MKPQEETNFRCQEPNQPTQTQHIETAITMHAYSSGGDNQGALHPRDPSPAQGKNQPGPNPAGTTTVCLPNGHPAGLIFVSPRFTHFPIN